MKPIVLSAIFCSVALMGGVVCADGTTNLSPTVEAQIYEGQIRSKSLGMFVLAEWRIEWPEAISGVSSDGLDAIQREMIDDCFGSLVTGRSGWEGKSVSQVLPTPDKALQLVFSRAYGKLDVSPEEDRPSMRSFDFQANLTIRFADAGYIGYVLEGYENEGGNGCHSYVSANVLLLETGRRITEQDFMTPAGMEAFPKVFFDRISRQPHANKYVIGDENDAKAAFGNFMFESEGIRWWLPAYSIFAGAAGVQDLLMNWQELKPFLKSGKDKEFKGIFTLLR